MKKFSALLVAICFISLALLTSTVAFAEQGQQKKLDPATERKVYDIVQACIAEKDNAKKLTMAKEAIGLYPDSQYIPYLKDQVNQARGSLLQDAMKNDKPEEAFKIGDEVLTETPDNLNYLLTLSEYSGRLAKGAKNYSFADKGTDYAKKAIALINNNQRPAGVEEPKWNESKPVVLASLHQTIGLFMLKAQKNDEAFTELSEAVKNNCSDPVSHYLLAQVHKSKYETLSNEYRQMPDDQKTSDAGKAVLEKINPVIDQIVESYAKMMAVSEGKQGFDGLRNGVKPDLEEFYKYRHEQKLDGLQAYIDGFKTSCK